jgi:hypothetical protein
MGSIGIISLTTRRNRRFFISAEHYPVVKVRPEESGPDRPMRTSTVAQRSAGRWPATGQDTDQGLDRRPGKRARYVGMCLGWSRALRFAALAGKAGGDEETRTPDPLLAKETLCQLSYVPRPSAWVMVGVSGLEPETSALSGQCSNQLS